MCRLLTCVYVLLGLVGTCSLCALLVFVAYKNGALSSWAVVILLIGLWVLLRQLPLTRKYHG